MSKLDLEGLTYYDSKIKQWVNNSPNVLKEFSNTVAYSIGDKVINNQNIYKFIINHTPGDFNTDEVELIGASESSGLEEFDPSKDYSIGDQVIYNGNIYKFIVDHPSGEWVNEDVIQLTQSGLTYEEIIEASLYQSKDEIVWGNDTISIPNGRVLQIDKTKSLNIPSSYGFNSGVIGVYGYFPTDVFNTEVVGFGLVLTRPDTSSTSLRCRLGRIRMVWTTSTEFIENSVVVEDEVGDTAESNYPRRDFYYVGDYLLDATLYKSSNLSSYFSYYSSWFRIEYDVTVPAVPNATLEEGYDELLLRITEVSNSSATKDEVSENYSTKSEMATVVNIIDDLSLQVDWLSSSDWD